MKTITNRFAITKTQLEAAITDAKILAAQHQALLAAWREYVKTQTGQPVSWASVKASTAALQTANGKVRELIKALV